jgi:hypothetical protein
VVLRGVAVVVGRVVAGVLESVASAWELALTAFAALDGLAGGTFGLGRFGFVVAGMLGAVGVVGTGIVVGAGRCCKPQGGIECKRKSAAGVVGIAVVLEVGVVARSGWVVTAPVVVGWFVTAVAIEVVFVVVGIEGSVAVGIAMGADEARWVAVGV